MRVLEITASSAFGGGPQHLFDLATELRDTVTIDIACPNQEPFWNKFNDVASGAVIEIPNRSVNFASLKRLTNHIRRCNVNLIHSHGKGAGVYGRLLSLTTGRPLVHTPHGIQIAHYGLTMRWVYRIYESVFSRIDAYTVFVSASERDMAHTVGYRTSCRSSVVHNGVRSNRTDLNKSEIRENVRSRREMGNRSMVAISLSRFDYAKNMQEAMAIAAQMPEVDFWFLGDGADRSDLIAQARANDIYNVWMPGFIPEPHDYLLAADMYLSTSRWEGMPLSVLQAMALGLPVIASNVVGNRDAVEDSVSGHLYEPGNPSDAANKIRRLTTERAHYHSVSKAARRRQRSLFSLEQMGAETLQIYEQVGGTAQF